MGFWTIYLGLIPNVVYLVYGGSLMFLREVITWWYGGNSGCMDTWCPIIRHLSLPRPTHIMAGDAFEWWRFFLRIMYDLLQNPKTLLCKSRIGCCLRLNMLLLFITDTSRTLEFARCCGQSNTPKKKKKKLHLTVDPPKNWQPYE